MKKIIESLWYHCGTDGIGIVKTLNDQGELQYYIGTGYGANMKEDEQRIANWGTRFSLEAGNILMPGHEKD